MEVNRRVLSDLGIVVDSLSREQLKRRPNEQRQRQHTNDSKRHNRPRLHAGRPLEHDERALGDEEKHHRTERVYLQWCIYGVYRVYMWCI